MKLNVWIIELGKGHYQIYPRSDFTITEIRAFEGVSKIFEGSVNAKQFE